MGISRAGQIVGRLGESRDGNRESMTAKRERRAGQMREGVEEKPTPSPSLKGVEEDGGYLEMGISRAGQIVGRLGESRDGNRESMTAKRGGESRTDEGARVEEKPTPSPSLKGVEEDGDILRWESQEQDR